MGKILALGDIQTLWAKVMGVPTMEAILYISGNT